jgi:hypothetical protein
MSFRIVCDSAIALLSATVFAPSYKLLEYQDEFSSRQDSASCTGIDQSMGPRSVSGELSQAADSAGALWQTDAAAAFR